MRFRERKSTGVSYLLLLITIVIGVESNWEEQENFLAYVVGTGVIDPEMAESLWTNCSEELLHAMETLQNLKSCSEKERSRVDDTKLLNGKLFTTKMHDVVHAWCPQVKQILLDCLLEKNLTPPIMLKEKDIHIWCMRYLGSLIPWHSSSIHRELAQSSTEIVVQSAPENMIVIVVAPVTFVVAIMLWCCRRCGLGSAGTRDKDNPLVTVSLSSNSGAYSPKSASVGSSMTEDKLDIPLGTAATAANSTEDCVHISPGIGPAPGIPPLKPPPGRKIPPGKTVHMSTSPPVIPPAPPVPVVPRALAPPLVPPPSAPPLVPPAPAPPPMSSASPPPPPVPSASSPPLPVPASSSPTPVPASSSPTPVPASSSPTPSSPTPVQASSSPTPVSSIPPPIRSVAPSSLPPGLPPPPPMPSSHPQSQSPGPTPPPPPPPIPSAGPRPPPPPVHSTDLQLRLPGPPPPPPKSSNINAGPHPPPPPGGGTPSRTSIGGIRAPTPPGSLSSYPTNKAKLKPFFWDKVAANPNSAMVWHSIRAGSFEFDEEMMENLFGYTAPGKTADERKKEPASQSQSTSRFIQLIDAKKSQNLSIILKALNVTADEVCDAIEEGNELPPELIETLVKMAPTNDEELKLRLYEDDLCKLNLADHFLKLMIEIPFAFKRLESLLFMCTFQEERKLLKESFGVLEAACIDLRKSRLFLKLLEAVLKTGNRMNDGTFRGGAQAFKLDTLLKLSDVKGVDGKTTLLHFVVLEIIRTEGIRACQAAGEMRRISSIEESEDMPDDPVQDSDEKLRSVGLQVVSGLSSELEHVKKAAILEVDVIAGTVAKINHGLLKAKEFLDSDLKSIDENNGFHQTLKHFVQNAEGDATWLIEEEKRITTLIKSTADYFHGKSGKDEGFRLFVIVRDFLMCLDKVCTELKTSPALSIGKSAKKEESTSTPAPAPLDPPETTAP